MNSSPAMPGQAEPQWQVLLWKLLRSRWTFGTLQGLDLLTTLVAFHAGAFEVNPLVARLTLQFGRFGGVLMSKVIAVGIFLGVKRLVWLVNLFYVGVVCWNIVVLIILSLKPH